ncbi:MAG: DUF4199 domain-containing protein [Bacteroidota bacterium]
MKVAIVKFGSYGLVFAFAAFLAGLYFDITTNVALGYATIIISLLFVYAGIRYFRDKENNGKLSFKQAIITGLLISTCTAIGIAIADYVYTTTINPDFFMEYAAKLKEKDPSAKIQEFTSGQAALFMFVVVFIIGLIISLLSSLILQRK